MLISYQTFKWDIRALNYVLEAFENCLICVVETNSSGEQIGFKIVVEVPEWKLKNDWEYLNSYNKGKDGIWTVQGISDVRKHCDRWITGGGYYVDPQGQYIIDYMRDNYGHKVINNLKLVSNGLRKIVGVTLADYPQQRDTCRRCDRRSHRRRSCAYT